MGTIVVGGAAPFHNSILELLKKLKRSSVHEIDSEECPSGSEEEERLFDTSTCIPLLLKNGEQVIPELVA